MPAKKGSTIIETGQMQCSHMFLINSQSSAFRIVLVLTEYYFSFINLPTNLINDVSQL